MLGFIGRQTNIGHPEVVSGRTGPQVWMDERDLTRDTDLTC